MRFVIVTGMSGAGRGTSLRMLEDMGYFCVDNLPVSLIGKFSELVYSGTSEISKVSRNEHNDTPAIMLPGYTYENVRIFRTAMSRHTAFAGITAHHLYGWYDVNQDCGRCGQQMAPDHKERMLYCPECHNMVYPRISPAVIVGVLNGDQILMSKYAGRAYTNYALIAGFTEIGESAEQTVAREVMEEVGLRVKNIRYYKSQPWAFSGSLLMGFFCDLDGDDKIILDKNELAEAGWFRRSEIDLADDHISLTR